MTVEDEQDHAGPLSVAGSDMSVPTPRLNQALEEVGLTSGQTIFPGNNMWCMFHTDNTNRLLVLWKCMT